LDGREVSPTGAEELLETDAPFDVEVPELEATDLGELIEIALDVACELVAVLILEPATLFKLAELAPGDGLFEPPPHAVKRDNANQLTSNFFIAPLQAR
jgi:hypothetical protein